MQKNGQSLDMPTPLCLQNFYGLLLGVSLRIFRPNLKFIALSVPEIIGSTALNFGSPCICLRSVFSIIFNRLLFAFGLRRAKVLG